MKSPVRCHLMKIHKVLAFAVFVGAFGMLTGLVSAHHSTAGYDMKKTSALKGTVAQWIWRNPHCILVWDVKDESGKITRWSGEMNSPISVTGLGLTRDSFKPGDELTVTVSSSPGLNESRVKPKPVTEIGEFISPLHRVIFPLSSFTSQTRMQCGFRHIHCATVPLSAEVFFMS